MSFSQERMSSVVLTNVVYPTYVEGRFVRHHTPGRCWNSLYTWDSGFIGLGLMEIDTLRAVENLNAYTTDPGNPDNCTARPFLFKFICFSSSGTAPATALCWNISIRV